MLTEWTLKSALQRSGGLSHPRWGWQRVETLFCGQFRVLAVVCYPDEAHGKDLSDRLPGSSTLPPSFDTRSSKVCDDD